MPVIAMTPELGTGGKDVARGLSDTLGLNLVYRKLVEHHVADRLRVPNSAVHRYLEGSANLLERWRMDKKGIRRCTAEELFELAERGNVLIRGWGGGAVATRGAARRLHQNLRPHGVPSQKIDGTNRTNG